MVSFIMAGFDLFEMPIEDAFLSKKIYPECYYLF